MMDFAILNSNERESVDLEISADIVQSCTNGTQTTVDDQ